MNLSRALPLAVVASVSFGCPETVEILEADVEGPSLALAAPNATQRFRITVETPGDAYPVDFYTETLRVVASLATTTDAGETSMGMFVATADDRTGDLANGQFERATMYPSVSELMIEVRLFDCAEDVCTKTVDVDFVKTGDGDITGSWRVEHEIDWTSDDDGDPPAGAVTILTINER